MTKGGRNKCCTVLPIDWNVKEWWGENLAISHREENTELQLRGTLHQFFFVKSTVDSRKNRILFYFIIFCCWLLNVPFSTAQMIKENSSHLLLNNTGADICPCIYCLHCSIWQNLFYPGNLLSPCEHACFLWEVWFIVSFSQPKKTKKQLGQGKEGPAENLMSGDHQVCKPIRRERWLVIPVCQQKLWTEALCFWVLRPSILP